MRSLLRFLGILLAGVLVFGAARLLDKAPWRKEAAPEQPRPTVAVQIQTEETAPEQSETLPVQTETAATTGPAQERFLLTFVGDCTLGSQEEHAYAEIGFIKTVGDDYGYPFRYVLDYFEKDELTCINLEGVLSDEGYALQRNQSFRGPAAYVDILTQNSVEAVTLANNHTMDYGQTGYASTKTGLEAAGIPYVERDSSTIITTQNGLTVGIYGAVYYGMDEEEITAAIRELRKQADIVIFAPHWGSEMKYARTREQIDLAHAVIDAGADFVWGSHPHVLQPMETYNGGVICYSLGNFSFGGNNYPGDYDSALIQQEVIRAADGTVSLGETIVVPVCISSVSSRNNFQPVPYEEGSEDYVRVMKKLDPA